MLKEFKEFAVKGNMMDMAVGIVIGAAFTSIINSLVNDIINPVIGQITGGVDFSNMYINLSSGEYESLSAAQTAGAATINYGLFINALISFLIVAWILFLIIKGVNKLRREKPKDSTQKGCPHCKSNIPIKATRCPECTSELEVTSG